MGSDPIEVLRRMRRDARRDAEWCSRSNDDKAMMAHLAEAKALDTAIASLSAPKPESAEAVAWRYQHNGKWVYTETPQREVERAHGFEPAQPLYTAPPRPEASAPVGVEALVGNWTARATTERAESKNKEWAEWLRENHAGAASAFTTCARELSAALAQQPAACVGCEGAPAPENSPCAVCGQQPAADEKPAGWWNGILPDVTDRSPYDPSIRWGADSEDSGHDIPLYAGVNPSRGRQQGGPQE